MFDLPVVRGNTYENSGLGAAILTAYGIGKFGSIEKAVASMSHVEKVFTPNKKNVQVYKSLFEKGYSKIYSALRPIYNKI